MSFVVDNLRIRRGATFAHLWRWGTAPMLFAAISGAAQQGPLRLTSTHGIVPDTWPIAISGVLGMTKINAPTKPPLEIPGYEYVIATKDGTGHLLVNSINSAGMPAYVSGGTVQYPTPADLSGYTARMQIRSSLDSDVVLLELTTANGGIVLTVNDASVALLIDADDTEAIDWLTGVYDVELVSGGGDVVAFAEGTVTVTKDVTR